MFFDTKELIGGFFIIALIVSNIAAWFTHVVVCIQDESWLFLIAGALFFPIAMVHGWGLWFGFF